MTFDAIQSAQAPMANSMAPSPSSSSQAPFSSALHLQKLQVYYEFSTSQNIFIFPKLEPFSYYTYNSLTGPCLHHKYELKISISACSHCDECLSTESGRIIRSANLWFTGSSELDSTRSGAQRNSTVALYSCKWHKSSTQQWCTVISDFKDLSPAYNVS